MGHTKQQLTLAQLAEQQIQTKEKYQKLVKSALLMASNLGADQTEIWCSNTVGNSIEIRNQELETLEFNQDSQLSINVYFDKRKGSASINDLTENGISKGVQAAVDIASFTQADPYAGIADEDRLAKEIKDFSLCHPSDLTIPQLIEAAKETETSALANKVVKQSEGASVYGHSSVSLYANSHDFFASKNTSRYSLSTTMIAENDSGMQRDGYYSVSRDFKDLESAQEIGYKASEKLAGRIKMGRAKAGKFPVIFNPDTARGIWGHMLNAIKGGALYQKSTFLLDKKGQLILPKTINIHEDPFVEKGFGSGSYDAEGVATYKRDIVADGILKDYLLSSYSARRLGLETTGSAGGIHNIFVDSDDIDQEQLIKKLGTGLLVTEVMGQGVNTVTGNYSRGAGGYWFENGEIKHFVQEITIAGNLTDMLKNIIAVGNDVDHRSSIMTGSIAMDGLTIATN